MAEKNKPQAEKAEAATVEVVTRVPFVTEPKAEPKPIGTKLKVSEAQARRYAAAGVIEPLTE